MTKPLSIQEQLRQSCFEPTHYIAILVGISRTDQVWQADQNGHPVQPAFQQNSSAGWDCVSMRECLMKFGVLEENIYNLMDASEHATNSVYIELLEKLAKGAKKDPPVNYLVVHCFSGAGAQVRGMHSIIFNEFDDMISGPRFFEAEYLLKKIAEDYPNSYQIGVFTSQRGQNAIGKCTRRPANTPQHTQKRESEASTDKYHSSNDSFNNKNHERNRSMNRLHYREKSAHFELDKIMSKFEQKAGERTKEQLHNMLATRQPPDTLDISLQTTASMMQSRLQGKNVILIYSLKEQAIEERESQAVRDFINLLMSRLHRETLSVQFPDVLLQLQGASENLEMLASNTICPVKLFYNHNIVTHTECAIFVNTHTRGLTWDKAQWKGKVIEKLFKDTFQFRSIQVLTDLTKRMMIDEFDRLQRIANRFEERKAPNETLCIVIIWIGHTLYLNTHHADLVQPRDAPPIQCNDGTQAPYQFGLTKYGEPVSLYEYCSRLCKGESTHLLQMTDWNPVHLSQLLDKHVDQSKNFMEMRLQEHPGWWRLSDVTYGVKEFCQHFATCREAHDQKVFQFPYHLIEADFEPTQWRSVSKPEQMIIDLRTQEEKALIRQNKNTNTLRKDYDIWQERPRIVAVEEGLESTLFSHMVHRLQFSDQIVHITMSDDVNFVEYIFHQDKPPFKELQRIRVARDHYRFAIVVKPIMRVQLRNRFDSVMFSNGCSECPSKALHFKRKDRHSPWEQPDEYQEPCDESFSEVFRNCYQIQTGNNEKVYLLFRDEHMIALDHEHYQIQSTNYMEDIDSSLTQCYAVREDFACNGTSFLMAFQIINDDLNPLLCRNQYKGNQTSNTWLMRVELDQGSLQLIDVNKKEESILFKNEACQAMCEYAPGKIAVYARPSHLFIVHDWQVIRCLVDQDSKNQNKYSIEPIPGFDIAKFPFLICSGEGSFNLFSVKAQYMEPLVNAATSARLAQTAFFFDKCHGGALTMHFTTTRANEENKSLQYWHTMHFQQDFMDILKANGRLPVNNPAETLAICKKVEELQEQKDRLIAEHAQQISRLKAKLPKSEREKLLLEDDQQRQSSVSEMAFLRQGEQVGLEKGKLVRNDCCRLF